MTIGRLPRWPGRWIATFGLVLPALGWQAPPGPDGDGATPSDSGPEIIDWFTESELSPAVIARFFSEDAIRVYDPGPIPDDPPPHEGAMFDLPHVFGPGDHIRIEVLNSLPGQPLTGERLVRPDGKVSLDFYGEIYVRGLTVDQVKIKVIERLRSFLIDEALGLIELELVDPSSPASAPEDDLLLPDPSRTRSPFDLDFEEVQPTSALVNGPRDRDDPGAGPSRITIDMGNGVRITIETPAAPPSESATPERSGAAPGPTLSGNWARYVVVPPVESNRVFVDVEQYNTPMYYITGDVAYPGRLHFTGNDTVLDALNYAGGFVSTADPTDIRLARPSRGDRPARVYAIDFEAILGGDATANLQIFPGDRLIVGRDPIVETSVALNRLAEPAFTFFNLIQSYGSTLRWLDEAGRALSAEEREEVLEGWVDLWLSIADRVGAGDVVEDEVREQIRRLLLEPPVPSRDDGDPESSEP